MTGFLLKKFVCDLWDNFFSILAVNFGFLIFLSLAVVLPPLLPAGGYFLLAALIFWLCLYLCAAAAALREISDYRRIRFANLAANLKTAFAPAAVLFVAAVMIYCVFRFTVPAYLGIGNIVGLAAAFFSCWLCFFVLAVVQFFPAVYYRLGRRPVKCLKKCVIIFFDNTGFCIFSLFFAVLLPVLIISCPCWSLLYLDEALRLRLLKYDWLETRKTVSGQRQKIPWKKLLEEEREKTGNPGWKSFFFPWKE